MEETIYLSEKDASLAKEVQATIAGLNDSFGVLFVSVTAVPAKKGDARELMVVIGLRSDIPKHAGVITTQKVIYEELGKREVEEKFKVYVEVFNGEKGKG